MNSSVTAGKNYITHSGMSQPQNQGMPCANFTNKFRLRLIIFLVIVACCFSVLRVGTSSSITASNVPDTKRTFLSSTPVVTNISRAPEMFEDKERQYFPHFIVIGVKKSGTRALLNFLKIHPDIVTATSEVHFFDRNETYKQGLEWYRQQMPFSHHGQLTGEKSPSYYREVYVPERIYAFNKTIKLILVVREPIERAMSNYLQHADTADLSHYPSFDSQVLLPNGEVNQNSPHIYNSDYSLFINNWLDYFPLEQIKVVDGNLLITHPHEVMKELQEFLGVRQYINEDFFKFDEEKGFYCYLNQSSILKCLGDSKGRKHPPISLSTKQKLYNYFSLRNQLFFKKIGRKFDWKVDLSSTAARK